MPFSTFRGILYSSKDTNQLDSSPKQLTYKNPILDNANTSISTFSGSTDESLVTSRTITYHGKSRGLEHSNSILRRTVRPEGIIRSRRTAELLGIKLLNNSFIPKVSKGFIRSPKLAQLLGLE